MRRVLYRLNSTVLSCRLNAPNCISSRRSAGKLFHTRGPATEKLYRCTRQAILKSIRRRTGSQCSCCRTGVMWSQSRLNVLGVPGPARLMGSLSSLWLTWRGGAVVLCTNESGNTHLAFMSDVKLRFTKWGLTCFDMPKCMNTVHCTKL